MLGEIVPVKVADVAAITEPAANVEPKATENAVSFEVLDFVLPFADVNSDTATHD